MVVKRIKCGLVRNVSTFFRQSYCMHLCLSKKILLQKKLYNQKSII